jgi:hypothetical protein
VVTTPVGGYMQHGLRNKQLDDLLEALDIACCLLHLALFTSL